MNVSSPYWSVYSAAQQGSVRALGTHLPTLSHYHHQAAPRDAITSSKEARPGTVSLFLNKNIFKHVYVRFSV